ncbi:MAG TPA: phage tail length tape measure family protein [Rhizobium sp.]
MTDNADDLIISISADQATLRRSIQRIEQTLDGLTNNVRQKFASVGKAIDDSISTSMQNRINVMVGVGTQGAKEWTGALVDQGKELERLRAKYSPLFATINQYKKNVEDVKRAHALGAISSAEYQAAMSRERQAALASTAAIKGRNAAAGQIPAGASRQTVSGFQTANIAAQFQDIAVTSAMGMNPVQIALQQGTQLSSVLATMGEGKNVVAGLATAFGSLFSPISLVTIGLTAGAAALIQYFSAAKDTKKVDEILKAHAENIAAIKGAYGEAANGLKDYVQKSEAETLFETTTRLNDTYKTLGKTASYLASQGPAALTGMASSFKDFPNASTKMQRAFIDLRKSVEEGTPRIVEFRATIAGLANDTSLPDAVREWARSLLEMDENVVKLAESVPGMVDAIKVIGGTAGDQIDRVASLSAELKKLFELQLPDQSFSESVSSVVNSGMSRLREFSGGNTINEEARRRLLIGQSRAEQANDKKYLNLPDGRRIENPAPTPRPNIEMEGLPGEVEKQEAAARKAANAAVELKKKQDDLLKTAGDRIEAIRLETSLVGKYGIAADNARFSLETWQKAEKLNLSDDQKKALQTRINQYAQLAGMLAKIKLYQDLNDQNRLSALPERDRQIVTMQRQYGLPEDPNSETGRAIGKSVDQQANREAVTSFLTDFKDGLVKNGESIGKAFGTALQSALEKQADKLWDKLFTQIGNALFGGSTTNGAGATGTGVAGLGATAVSKIFGGSSSKATNPIMAGNMSAYAEAIKSVESSGNYGALGPVLKSGDRAYGAYQVMGANVPSWTKAATGTAMTPNAFLNDKSTQDAVFNKYFGASVSKYGNPQDAASVWFSGRPLSKAGNASDGFNTTPEYITKFNSALGDASKNVGTFGSGLGQIGNSLTSGIFPAAPTAAGANGGGIFGSLFANLFSNSSQFKAASAGKLLPGLFADGGYTGPGGKNTPAGIVHAGEYVVPKHIVDKIGVPALSGLMKGYAEGGLVTPALVSAPSAPTLRARGGPAANSNQPGILHVQISGASGDDHIRTLVKQGVGDGLNTYNTQQQRGGFGTMQNRFANQKA